MPLNPDELDDAILVCALRWEVDTWTAPQVRQMLARIRAMPAHRNVVKDWQDLGRCWAERRRLDAFRRLAQAFALDRPAESSNEEKQRAYVRHALRAGRTAALRQDDPRLVRALNRRLFQASHLDTIDLLVEAATLTPPPVATLVALRRRPSEEIAAAVNDLAMEDLDEAIRGVLALVPAQTLPEALLTVMRYQAFHLPDPTPADELVARLQPHLPVTVALADLAKHIEETLEGPVYRLRALNLADAWACQAPEPLARAWLETYPNELPHVRAHLRQQDLAQRPAPPVAGGRRRS